MELAGNEQKIHTLFRELKLADEGIAPEFTRVWNRAQSSRIGSPRVFKISSAMATAVVLTTMCFLVLWARNWQPRPSNPGIATRQVTNSSAPLTIRPGPTNVAVAEPSNRIKSNHRYRKVVVRHQADFNARKLAVRESVSISSWQSPTATLMQSPADNVLMSLPQLDRSVTELKTFLPGTSQ